MLGTRSRRALVVAYGAALLWLSPLLVAGGASAESERVASPDEVMRRDAILYAEAFGVPVAEAERRLTAAGKLLTTRVEIRKLADVRFAGSWVEHTPKFRAVVLVSGEEPLVGVDMLLEDASAYGEVVIQLGAQFTYEELLSGLARLDEGLSDYPGASVGLRLSENSVVFRSPGSLTSLASESVRARARVPVLFEVGEEVTNQHTWGARSLYPPGCTTGFTAKTANGIKGVLSAAHCDNVSNKYHQNADISYPMTVFYDFYDNDEDWEYVKEPNSVQNPHPVEPKFWSGFEYRIVTNGDAPPVTEMEGDFVCHYGRGSQAQRCGIIDDATYDPGDICGGPCSAQFVKVVDIPGTTHELDCQGGDSGGPWFTLNQAYGIHKAGTSGPPGPGHICVLTTTHKIDGHNFDILEG